MVADLNYLADSGNLFWLPFHLWTVTGSGTKASTSFVANERSRMSMLSLLNDVFASTMSFEPLCLGETAWDAILGRDTIQSDDD